MSDNLRSLESNQAPAEAPVKKKSSFREYAEALLTAALIAFFLRAFVVEAFKIPSKSMVPTLMVGDHIFVNKFTYGIRLPFTKYWLLEFKKPERGEVVVFKYPADESLDFIKRVVGVPGDRVKVEGDDLFINDQKVQVEPIVPTGVNPKDPRELVLQPPGAFPDGERFTSVPFSPEWEDFTYYLERLGDHTHIKQEGGRAYKSGETFVVPQGKFFVMGDNRDNSSDSREWGYVPIENLKGKAMFIWLSRDHDKGGIRWDRFGKWIR